MANTYVAIATITVGSGGSSTIDFTSIPSTYTDLVLKISGRSSSSTTAEDYVMIYFNGSTTGYSVKRLYGTGSGTGSDSVSNKSGGTAGSRILAGVISAGTSTASTFGSVDIYIPNYSSSSNKSVLGDGVSENNDTFAIAQLSAGLWSNTAAINQITVDLYFSGNFTQYSTATLYGIKNS